MQVESKSWLEVVLGCVKALVALLDMMMIQHTGKEHEHSSTWGEYWGVDKGSDGFIGSHGFVYRQRT